MPYAVQMAKTAKHILNDTLESHREPLELDLSSAVMSDGSVKDFGITFPLLSLVFQFGLHAAQYCMCVWCLVFLFRHSTTAHI